MSDKSRQFLSSASAALQFLSSFVFSCENGGSLQRQRPSEEDDETRRADDAAPAVGHDAPAVDRQTWREVPAAS